MDIILMWYVIQILISEREFTDTNYDKLKKALIYTKNNWIDSNDNMFW